MSLDKEALVLLSHVILSKSESGAIEHLKHPIIIDHIFMNIKNLIDMDPLFISAFTFQ